MEHVLDGKSKFELESMMSRKRDLEETLQDFHERKPQISDDLMKYLFDASGDGTTRSQSNDIKLHCQSSPEKE